MLIDVRIKNRIHIYMHQILKVFVITACNRIYCLIRIRHCVKKRVKGSLNQFHERIFHRKISRAAQYRMLHDMRNPCAVRRRCPKSDGKHLILIVIFHQQNPRPALSVFQQDAL